MQKKRKPDKYQAFSLSCMYGILESESSHAASAAGTKAYVDGLCSLDGSTVLLCSRDKVRHDHHYSECLLIHERNLSLSYYMGILDGSVCINGEFYAYLAVYLLGLEIVRI